jgi:hypothetical protein
MTTYRPPALSATGQLIADQRRDAAHRQELAAAARYLGEARAQKDAENTPTAAGFWGAFAGFVFAVLVVLCVALAVVHVGSSVVDAFSAAAASGGSVDLGSLLR